MGETSFLLRPGRAGPFGALMDETARAAEDFCRVVESLDASRFATERESQDPDTRSPRAICLHVVGAQHRYADYVRKALGLPHEESWLPDPDSVRTPADVRRQLAESVRYCEDAVEPLHDATHERVRALEFPVRWGPLYDPEMLLEHAVCHLLRHRRQLERW